MFYIDENGKGSIQSIIPDELEIRPKINVSKEWAELFLKNWNRAVALWDDGHMFRKHYKESDEYEDYQLRDQQEYARICCSWIIPNKMVEPHCVAEGL